MRISVLLLSALICIVKCAPGNREKRWIPERYSDSDYGMDAPGGGDKSGGHQSFLSYFWPEYFQYGSGGDHSSGGGDYSGLYYRAGGGGDYGGHAMTDPVQMLQHVQTMSYAQALHQQYPQAFMYGPPPPGPRPLYQEPYPVDMYQPPQPQPQHGEGVVEGRASSPLLSLSLLSSQHPASSMRQQPVLTQPASSFNNPVVFVLPNNNVFSSQPTIHGGAPILSFDALSQSANTRPIIVKQSASPAKAIFVEVPQSQSQQAKSLSPSEKVKLVEVVVNESPNPNIADSIKTKDVFENPQSQVDEVIVAATDEKLQDNTEVNKNQAKDIVVTITKTKTETDNSMTASEAMQQAHLDAMAQQMQEKTLAEMQRSQTNVDKESEIENAQEQAIVEKILKEEEMAGAQQKDLMIQIERQSEVVSETEDQQLNEERQLEDEKLKQAEAIMKEALDEKEKANQDLKARSQESEKALDEMKQEEQKALGEIKQEEEKALDEMNQEKNTALEEMKQEAKNAMDKLKQGLKAKGRSSYSATEEPAPEEGSTTTDDPSYSSPLDLIYPGVMTPVAGPRPGPLPPPYYPPPPPYYPPNMPMPGYPPPFPGYPLPYYMNPPPLPSSGYDMLHRYHRSSIPSPAEPVQVQVQHANPPPPQPTPVLVYSNHVQTQTTPTQHRVPIYG